MSTYAQPPLISPDSVASLLNDGPNFDEALAQLSQTSRIKFE